MAIAEQFMERRAALFSSFARLRRGTLAVGLPAVTGTAAHPFDRLRAALQKLTAASARDTTGQSDYSPSLASIEYELRRLRTDLDGIVALPPEVRKRAEALPPRPAAAAPVKETARVMPFPTALQRTRRLQRVLLARAAADDSAPTA